LADKTPALRLLIPIVETLRYFPQMRSCFSQRFTTPSQWTEDSARYSSLRRCDI